MPALTDLRDQACLVGIGETDYTRGTPKSALELALEASLGAIGDTGLQPGDIDAVILPNGAGSGGTAGDFCANLGLQDLHYTISLQEMGGAMCVSAVESAATALASGIARYALIPLCSRFYSGRRARQVTSDPGTGLQAAETITTTEKATPFVRLPVLGGYTKEFYDWCQQRELRFQCCQQCGTWRHPPRPMCTGCHSLEWEWAPTKGTGTVYCWTTVYQALDPAFAEDVPYAAVVVELDDGPRLTTWVTGVVPDELHVGMPVEVWFDTVSDDVTLPKFRPQLPL